MRRWRSFAVTYVSLNGEKSEAHIGLGGSVTYFDTNHKPILRVSIGETNSLTVEQLAPTLTLDAATAEWAASQPAG